MKVKFIDTVALTFGDLEQGAVFVGEDNLTVYMKIESVEQGADLSNVLVLSPAEDDPNPTGAVLFFEDAEPVDEFPGTILQLSKT